MKTEKKRLTFGLVVDWISGWGDLDYYQTKIISGVTDYAKANDINVICFVVGRLGSPYEWERSRNLLFNFIHKNHVDGLIIMPTAIEIYEQGGKMLSILDSIKDLPIVTLTEGYGKYHTITTNNYSGIHTIVKHVIEEHHCRRLAFLGGPKNSDESQERFQAFYDALKEHNIPYYPELNFEGNFLYQSGNDTVKYLLDNGLDFDALICANDNMAIGAMSELHARLGKIPEHLSITGFDDSDSSKPHALTTVKQPFYEQAQASANMLHNLISGMEVDWVKELPSEVIIRSSCGCMGNVMHNTFVELNASQPDSLEALCQSTKKSIIAELELLNKGLGLTCVSAAYERLVKYENSVIDAFYNEFFNDQRTDFLNTWNSFVFWAILNVKDMSFTQDVLACLRKNILSNLVKNENLITAENMFQAASIIICDAIQRTAASISYITFAQTEGLASLAEGLMSNLDWKAQMDALYEILPQYNIKKGYIAVYEDNQMPLDDSNLILAFAGTNRTNVGDKGIRFKTLNILPQASMEDLRKERFNIIVMALHQGDTPLGYAVFSYEEKVNKVFEIARHNIGVALHGALLVENIKNQALDLERQVEERTHELSKTNQTLINEISKRKEVQEQLSAAMKQLERHNIQLQTESSRDELTGLYNRRGFMKLSGEFLEKSERAEAFLILFGDLDDLKRINDQYGHTEGDFALKKTAAILNQTFKTNDIISRLSGDEFIVMILGASGKDEACIKERVRYNFNCYNENSDKPYILSISTGFAYFNPKKPLEFDALLKQADDGLYQEKQLKRLSLNK